MKSERTFTCQECWQNFFTPKRSNHTLYCNKCEDVVRKRKTRERVARFRARHRTPRPRKRDRGRSSGEGYKNSIIPRPQSQGAHLEGVDGFGGLGEGNNVYSLPPFDDIELLQKYNKLLYNRLVFEMRKIRERLTANPRIVITGVTKDD